MNPANEPGDLDNRLEAEIEAALGDMSLEDMLDFEDHPQRMSGGERARKTGTIVSVHGGDVFVEFGPKSQGVCPVTLFEAPPAVGEQLEFIIERYDEDQGLLILSRRGKVAKAEWESLEVGQVVEARCTGTNKGGLEMEVANHRAFMPAGQVDLRHIDELNVFVGEKLPCEVIELDRNRGRIVLSRKTVLAAERAELREKLLEELEVGRKMTAVITSLKPYGAFADLGGLDGLIHISDLAWERVKEPSDVVREGQQVTVQVLSIDRAQDPVRISLGMKQCIADPYEAQAGQLEEGATVTGKVTKLMPFGAFVELAPGVEGLIHISELSHDRVSKVSSVVKPEEVVTVRILKLDPASRRISLSLKAARQDEESATARKEDPELRRLKAMLGKKFGENLKGGIG